MDVLTPTPPLQHCPTSMLHIGADWDFHEHILSCERKKDVCTQFLSSPSMTSFFTLVTGLCSAGFLRPNVIPDQHGLHRVLEKRKLELALCG